DFPEQHGEQHPGPLGATGLPVLNYSRVLREYLHAHGAISLSGAAPSALEEMNPGCGREPLQLLHGENQRTVHHAVDHEAMLLGVDIRDGPGRACSCALHET